MGFFDRYRTPADLPQNIPVFPLSGALLLPRAELPLNIFEPRYLAMVNHALSTDRLIGIIQPAAGREADDVPAAHEGGLRGPNRRPMRKRADERMLITLAGRLPLPGREGTGSRSRRTGRSPPITTPSPSISHRRAVQAR